MNKKTKEHPPPPKKPQIKQINKQQTEQYIYICEFMKKNNAIFNA